MSTDPTVPSRTPIRLFSVDLDGTLLGNPESAQRFKEAWEALPRNERPALVYNSGRSVKDALSLIAARTLTEAEFIIGGVGELSQLSELADGILAKAMESPEAKKFYENTGTEPVASTPEELARFQEAESKKWGRIIEAAGIEAE